MDQNFTVHELPDQSRLMLIPMEGCRTFALYMCVSYGWDNVQSKKDYETAHYLEHLYASLPSAKHPVSSENDLLFAQRGIYNNAFTYPDRTVYMYLGLSKHLSVMTEMLLAAYRGFKIDETVFDQEKKAVMNELKRYMSEPLNAVDEKLDEHLYQHNNLLKEGTLEARYQNVSNITVQELLDIHKARYSGKSILFVVAGGFSSGKVLDYFKRNIAAKKHTRVKSLPNPSYYAARSAVTLKTAVPALKSTFIQVSWLLPVSWYDQGIGNSKALGNDQDGPSTA